MNIETVLNNALLRAGVVPSDSRDLRSEFYANGPLILPASSYASTTAQERALLGLRTGTYGFLTLELIDWLIQRIGDRSAIEIGSGNGALARALAIPATDSKMQENPEIAALYSGMVQPTVTYGDNVKKLSAEDAVTHYKPKVVIANWVTHLYKSSRHESGGSIYGVNEERIIKSCEEYIFIGNEAVHAGKSIWSLPHEIIYPDWLYSRAINGSRNFISVWRRQ